MKPHAIKKLDHEKHYWLCSKCAEDGGGVFPKGHVCTVMRGKCPYCGIETTVVPWVDFNWPKERRLDGRARVLRD